MSKNHDYDYSKGNFLSLYEMIKRGDSSDVITSGDIDDK